MIDRAGVQDRLNRGMGAGARVLGAPYDLFRPRGATRPLAPGNRVMRLPVVLDGGDPGYRRPRGYERGMRAMFDGVLVRPGDYLVGVLGVLFVAGMPPLQRALCVAAGAVLDVVRPGGAGLPGLNGYGGVGEAGLAPVLSGWPGQMAVVGRGKSGAVPGDGGASEWSVLLPGVAPEILASDLVQDESGRRFVVQSAELSAFGWRLTVRQAGV